MNYDIFPLLQIFVTIFFTSSSLGDYVLSHANNIESYSFLGLWMHPRKIKLHQCHKLILFALAIWRQLHPMET